jgi:hypothetical protein
MPYNLPDVFVNVDIPEPSPTITSPGLSPCVVGEHYFVAREQFVATVGPGATGPWDYKGLPDSTQSDSKLSVDVSSEYYSPKFYLITDGGDRRDITDRMSASASDFSLASGEDFPESGSLFVSYRARHDKYAGTNVQLLTASSVSDLQNYFSEDGLTPANPLGYAMFQCLTHNQLETTGVAVTNPTSGGTGSYSDPISNELGAYQEALDFLRKQDVYMTVPLTMNSSVHSAFEAHVDYMSSPQGNQERRTIVVPEMNGETDVRQGQDFTPWYPISDDTSTDLADSLGTENEGSEITRDGYRIVKTGTDTFYIRGYPASSNGSSETIQLEGTSYVVNFSGMMLVELEDSAVRPASQRIESSDEFIWSDPAGSEVTGTIQSVPIPAHENIIEIDVGSASPVDGAPWSVRRSIDPVTERSKFVDAYKQKARSISNERVTLMTPHWVGDTQVEHDVPAYFVAAQLAGEVCLTSEQPAGAAPGVDPYTSVRESTEHLFKSVRYFTDSELQEIAGSGWTILQNVRPGTALNTMHTVTTDASAIERMELILGVERDYLARFFRQEMSDDLREFRINERTINSLAIRADEIAASLSDSQSQHYRYRSVVVDTVRQDESTPDRIVFDVEAEHLYPYNEGKVNVSIIT